jgi:hypothetical protein
MASAASFASLPPPLAGAVFALLPVDTRLRCREVCRAWRDGVIAPSLWTALDLSPRGGVARRAATCSLLRAAAARAGNALEALDLSECAGMTDGSDTRHDETLAVLADNADMLCELSWT